MREWTAEEGYELVARFTIEGEPVSKSRARFTKRGSKMIAYTPQKTMDGERAVAAAFLSVAKRRETDKEATFAVSAHFQNGTRQRRDVDNMVKLILDGLNDYAWPDDNQVMEISARKSFGPKSEARTEVAVYKIGDMGYQKASCIHCGSEFRTYDSWANNPSGRKYCTPKCATIHRVSKKARTCEECGNGFQAWGESKETRFCSMDCNSANKRAVVQCGHCSETFTKQRSMLRKVNYCSTECQQQSEKDRNKSRRAKYFPGKCAICGGGTTRKEYVRCNPCKLGGVTGKPKFVEGPFLFPGPKGSAALIVTVREIP